MTSEELRETGDVIDRLHSTIERLQRENAELKRDAERYRGARQRVTRSQSVVPVVDGLQDDFTIRLPFIFDHEGSIPERFDAAIDAALAK